MKEVFSNSTQEGKSPGTVFQPDSRFLKKIFFFSYASILFFCASPPPIAETPSPKISKRSETALKFLDKFNIALIFSGQNSSELEDELKTALLKSERVNLIDRQKTADALNELSLNQTGITDPKNAPKLGKILSAQKLVYLKSSTPDRWSLELADVETSKLEFVRNIKKGNSERVFQELAGLLTQNLLVRNLSILKPKNPNIKVSLNSTKNVYKENESVGFTVTASEDCYIYLILLQSDGETILLFPNTFTPENFVHGNNPIQIPDGKSGYILAAGEPFGTDTLKVIASKSQLDLFRTKPYGDSPFGRILEPVESVNRGIKIIQTSVSEGDWNVAEMNITTKEN